MNIIDNLDVLIELVDGLAFFKNLNGEHTHCNNAYLDFFQKSRAEVIGKTSFDLYSHENATRFNEDDKDTLATGKNKYFEQHFTNDDGSTVYFHTTKKIVYGENGEPLGLLCMAKDITLQKQYKLIYEDNQALLEYIAKQNDITDVLDKIVHLAEARNTNSKCSILLLNESKKNLLKGSAPSLPDFYNDAINGVEIGEKVGSCGSATFKQERVIVENIDTHENWQPYLALTQKANLHACWSEPIFSSKGEILGSFAIYNDKPKSPNDFELKLISSYAHLASVVIEKENNFKRLKEKELQILKQTQDANKKLRTSQYELAQIFNNALVGLMYIDQNRVLMKGNQHLADIFGYDNPEEMIGLNLKNIHLSEKNFIEFGQTYFQSLIYKESLNIEYQFRKKDGSSVWCEVSGKALDHNIPADLSQGILWTLNNISQRKILEENLNERTKEIENKNTQLKELAAKDHLTGLYNRSKIDEVLEYLIKRANRHHTAFGVIMVDIDYFKVVNDKYGHQVGDSVLCEFANLLTHASRETDIVGRWGGEEFLIVVENTNEDGIVKLAEKLRVIVEANEFAFINKKTASFGVTVYHAGDKINSLINRADKALYEAKNSGRNQVVIKNDI
jgi:diguanylate cyclase (GGDEF)-like protein/PAS domain S-box-containing protein